MLAKRPSIAKLIRVNVYFSHALTSSLDKESGNTPALRWTPEKLSSVPTYIMGKKFLKKSRRGQEFEAR